MAFTTRLILVAIGVFLCSFQVVDAGVTIEIKFLNYSDSCREDASTSKCDPKFTFCVDRPKPSPSISPCFYESKGESSHYQDTNFIDFSQATNIKGIPNPWIIKAKTLMEPSIMFVVQVNDDDFIQDDHLQTWSIILKETVHSSKNIATWTTRRMTSGSHSLFFQIRIYCDNTSYASSCTNFCNVPGLSPDDATCDPNTAINNCNGGVTCPPEVNICHNNLCSNNATCTPTGSLTYNCTCVGNWEGAYCNITINPCKSSPCQNGMECRPSADNWNYSCSCTYPFTGIHCETVISETSTLQTPATETFEKITTEQNYNETGEITTTGQNYNETEVAIMTVKAHTEAVMITTTGKSGDVFTPGAQKANTEEAGFLYWHGIIIGIIVLLVIIIIIVFLLVRMRHRKKKFPCGRSGNLSFENNVYNDVNRSPSRTEEQTRFKQPLPTTPTDDEHFVSMAPVFTANGTGDVQGAEGGGGYVELDMDADGYVKSTYSVCNKGDTKKFGQPKEKERAETNPYSDFSSLTSKPEAQGTVDEVHYHDLDEIAMAVKNLDGTSQVQTQDRSFSEGQADVLDQFYASPKKVIEATYAEAPSNIPVLFSANGSIHHSSLRNENGTDSALMSPSCNDFLPGDGGYDSPRSFNYQKRALDTQESQYDTPPSNRASKKSSSSKNDEIPESSTVPNPASGTPATTPKSSTYRYENITLPDGNEHFVFDDLFSKTEESHPQSVEGNTRNDFDNGDDLLSKILFQEGYTFPNDDNDSKEDNHSKDSGINIPENTPESTKSVSTQALNLEIYGSSNS